MHSYFDIWEALFGFICLYRQKMYLEEAQSCIEICQIDPG